MNKRIEEEIDVLQAEIKAKQKEISDLRSQLELEEVKDYSLLDAEGNSVLLSSLFDERNELLVIHNMGKQCSYCTLWADGFNGFAKPLTDRVPFVVVSPDLPEVQQAFAASSGWTFPMLSSNTSSFFAELGFEPKPGIYYPGVSAFIRKDNKIYRTAHDYFGAGDVYCSVWHLFDLLPNKHGGWHPKIEYK